MTELACPHCEYEWEYSGERNHYATCPDCRGNVKIQESEVTAE